MYCTFDCVFVGNQLALYLDNRMRCILRPVSKCSDLIVHLVYTCKSSASTQVQEEHARAGRAAEREFRQENARLEEKLVSLEVHFAHVVTKNAMKTIGVNRKN